MINLEERVFQWLLKRSARQESGRLRSQKIVASICDHFNSDPLTIRKMMERLKSDGKLGFTASANGEPISAYITVNRQDQVVLPHAELWMRVLDHADLSSAEKSILEPLHAYLEGFSDVDMNAILTGLRELRSMQAEHRNDYVYAVSAKYLLGSSKLLSRFESRRLKAFGIDIESFQDRPPYVMIGGNGYQPDAVILIENPTSFEVAVQSKAASSCAFICTFGFGLSNSGNEFGYQLAGAVENGKAIILRRTEGAYRDFSFYLNHPNCHFWGDLDAAGMHIFMRLKRKLPQLLLSSLYMPMIKAVIQPETSHPYNDATGKVGQTPFHDGDSVAVELAKLCTKRSVCQEIVRADAISGLANKAITIDDIVACAKI